MVVLNWHWSQLGEDYPGTTIVCSESVEFVGVGYVFFHAENKETILISKHNVGGGTVSQDKISVSVYTRLGVNRPFGCSATITWRENNRTSQ